MPIKSSSVGTNDRSVIVYSVRPVPGTVRRAPTQYGYTKAIDMVPIHPVGHPAGDRYTKVQWVMAEQASEGSSSERGAVVNKVGPVPIVTDLGPTNWSFAVTAPVPWAIVGMPSVGRSVNSGGVEIPVGGASADDREATIGKIGPMPLISGGLPAAYRDT